jgi:hypothetical protein
MFMTLSSRRFNLHGKGSKNYKLIIRLLLLSDPFMSTACSIANSVYIQYITYHIYYKFRTVTMFVIINMKTMFH